ncbi:VOC family protein [Bradyrhizobium erythrophlei]|uniref:VOC family protein n=1 Tax=Bradyrhizobium erythrophlei TaxID=1437360 RepID=UPI0009A75A2F
MKLFVSASQKTGSPNICWKLASPAHEGSHPATLGNDQDREGPTDQAIRRIRSVEIQIEGFQHTSRFLTERLGFEEFGQDGAVFRFLDGPPDRPIAVDLLCTPTHRPSHTGPGVAHHIALRVADSEALDRIATMLANCGFDVTPPLNRQYFQAVYFRGPCGVNFAIATDGPGFATDVPNQRSGEMVSLPPWLEPKRTMIERRLRHKDSAPAKAPEAPKKAILSVALECFCQSG